MFLKEEAVRFGSSDALVGVVTDPARDPCLSPPLGVLFLNSGLTHHVGPNRLYVTLARELASLGLTAFRFDYSGIGDSEARRDGVPPEQGLLEETREAMAHLTASRGIERFILLGICSGAAVAYLAARTDSRVKAAALINAQGHLHGTDPRAFDEIHVRAATRHSWRMALFSSFRGKNWRKALKGRLNVPAAIAGLIGNPIRRLLTRPESNNTAVEFDPIADIRSVTSRGVRLLHLYSEGDEGLDYFHVVTGGDLNAIDSLQHARVEIIDGANHMFTLRWSQERLVGIVCSWIREMGAGTAPAN
jgi:pimeloyl-ACP methyl ester carboxylesterase